MQPAKSSNGILIILALCLLACGNKGKYRDHDNIHLDQEVTNRNRPIDTVFQHFEKNWKKFISVNETLIRPVMLQTEAPAWEPLIFTDCSYYDEAGANVPTVELTWNARLAEQPIRFDIAVHHQAFEKNYYTSLVPAAKETRFNIPGNSSFLRDTAAVLLTGPALFPKLVHFQQQPLPPGGPNQGDQAGMNKQVLRITELGSGLSYRLRMCTFDKEVWRPTQEVIFTTPICPTDLK